ncbi:hypothetical protein C9I99_18575 [Photobacterium lutimaris]|uniref:Uncharacterized protein n=1 Tax=Photobacterium lutimaris TaxID=388278 RepID=A0A2T3IV02_9GAMM|nr:hypothetical protein C9I99_18575 [Photobacterium lutimaris]
MIDFIGIPKIDIVLLFQVFDRYSQYTALWHTPIQIAWLSVQHINKVNEKAKGLPSPFGEIVSVDSALCWLAG